jgi:hypothetical protein
MEHASMLIERIPRHNSDFERFLRTYLFTEGSILEAEMSVTAMGGAAGGSDVSSGSIGRGFTIGLLRS